MDLRRKILLAGLGLVLFAGLSVPSGRCEAGLVGNNVWLHHLTKHTPLLRYHKRDLFARFGPQRGTDPDLWLYDSPGTDGGIVIKFFDDSYPVARQIGWASEFKFEILNTFQLRFIVFPPRSVPGYRIAKEVKWFGSVLGPTGFARQMQIAYIRTDAVPELNQEVRDNRRVTYGRFPAILVSYDLWTRTNNYWTSKFDPKTYAQRDIFNAKAYLHDACIAQYIEEFGTWFEDVPTR